MSAAAAPPLVATKLHPAAAGRPLVPRTELLARLGAEPLPKVTLVDAPPGWGKTTLLADWAAGAADGRRFAWVSLDPGDDDPVRFWLYVVAALRSAEPSLGDEAEALLNAPSAGVVDVALASLVNELEALDGRRIVLVLDDLHAVTNRDVHEQLERLVERLPETLRLVLATRADPPLPLPRMRARGELREVRAEHLRFTSGEADAFLNGVLGLGLDAADVGLLHGRTEGWAAGIYLAALSLEGRSDRTSFIAAFAGDDRHVVDYLVTEVLDRLDERLRDFLLRTSILDRLAAPLCAAVADAPDAAAVLAEIERSNLFLVPLDTTRQWYRYHHLFGDLLRHELDRVHPELVPELHRRACAWHRGRGLVSAAIRHAVAARDVDAAAELVGLHWNEYVNHGRSGTVAAWLALLPADAVRADARLALARAGSALTLGRRDEVEPWLDAAERASAGGVRRGAASVEAEAAIYRAVHLYMVGDFERASEAGRRAVELERDPASPWRAMACAALGRSLFWEGSLDEAAPHLEEAVRRRHPGTNSLSVIGALGYLAAIRAEQGDPAAAEQLAGAGTRLAADTGLAEHWVVVPALVAAAHARRARGDAEGAADRARSAVELARRGAGSVERAFALGSLAEALEAGGTPEQGAAALAEAHEALDGRPPEGMLGVLLDRAGRRLRPRRRPAGEDAALSERELAVLRLLPSDRSLREIGSTLFVSQNTVKTHTRSIYRKLDVAGRREAVLRARERGLL